MATNRRYNIQAYRNDPAAIILTMSGVDLTGVTMAFAVKLKPDVAGDPLIARSTASGAGITLLDVAVDADGIPTSTVQILISKSQMAALPAAAEPGASLVLAYDLQWTPPSAITAPATSIETTFMSGNFVVLGSVND